MSRPLLVGITGGIGAGKSVIAKIFNCLGTPIYDADARAKWLMSNSENLISATVDLFGDESYVDGHLNREFIASVVFNNPTLLTKLNELVHPSVESDFNRWISENSACPYLVKEAALLFETESYLKLDKLILVTAPLEIKMKRILERDPQRTEDEVKAIMNKQLSDEKKVDKSDIVLCNDGSNLLIPQILKLHGEFSQ